MNNTTDDQILEAMKRLANVLREAKREAGEAVVSAARKTELEAWIERHEAEIDARIIVSNGTPSASRQALVSERYFGITTVANCLAMPWLAARQLANARNELTGGAEAFNLHRSRRRPRERRRALWPPQSSG